MTIWKWKPRRLMTGNPLEKTYDPLRGTFQRSSAMANNVFYDNSCEVELTTHYSGSGLGSFGFTDPGEKRQWPHINVSVSLPVWGEDLRSELATEFMKVIDRFLEKHNLEV